MIDEAVIVEARAKLARAAPEARVILFGSSARREAGPDSDLDLLVIQPEVVDRHREMVRLSRELRSLNIRVDIVVVSRKYFDEWASVAGTLMHAASVEGRTLDVAA